MLEPAIKYQDLLRIKFRETWFKDRYKFWNCANYFEEHSSEESAGIVGLSVNEMERFREESNC